MTSQETMLRSILAMGMSQFESEEDKFMRESSQSGIGSKVTRRDLSNSGDCKIGGTFDQPICLALEHHDYLLLMKILYGNILYNDQMNDLFGAKSEESYPKPSGKSNVYLVKPNQSTIGLISIAIKLPRTSIIALGSNSIPFVKLSAAIVEVNVQMSSLIEVSMRVNEFKTSYFTQKHENLIVEKPLLGQEMSLEKISQITKETFETWSLNQFSSSLAHNRQEPESLRMSSTVPQEREITIAFTYKEGYKGSKQIEIDLENLEGYLILPVIKRLGSFFSLDESVHPVKPEQVPMSI